ncbi:hypothetical protein BDFB_014667 [Asbolus verrucosus]|uniref:Uncharacterized protein n=1 Tax=Asbolus verrucosus TaxID=1661398 RepID=A0A482W076_ASBVE|nr:hypothetical protein BDFB_014667 [Asbolus verrucosus]
MTGNCQILTFTMMVLTVFVMVKKFNTSSVRVPLVILVAILNQIN